MKIKSPFSSREYVLHRPFAAPKEDGILIANPTLAKRARNWGWLPLKPNRQAVPLAPESVEVLRHGGPAPRLMGTPRRNATLGMLRALPPCQVDMARDVMAHAPNTGTSTAHTLDKTPSSDDPGSKPLSATLDARIGFELELNGVHVEPFVPWDAVLMKGIGWELRVDALPQQGKQDLEFVFSPMESMREIEAAAREISALLQRIREKSQQHGEVSLADFPECPHPDHTLRVTDPHLIATLQSTYGVGLNDIGGAIDANFPPDGARAIHERTRKIEECFRAKHASDLTPAARGFVELLAMYLVCARGGNDMDTAHVNFRMMSRSDFCSIHDKLLAPSEKAEVAKLLLSGSATEAPLLMEALNMPPNAYVFRAPYAVDHARSDQGPTVQAWLESIVRGRDEGTLRKDLLSPPPGYRLHSEDSHYGDYSMDEMGVDSMGAMGVDEKKGLVLLEVRKAPYRQSVWPRHADDFVAALAKEYREARKYNSALEDFVPQESPSPSSKLPWNDDPLAGLELPDKL